MAARRCPPRSRARSSSHFRSEEHTSELQSLCNLVCRLLLEKKSTHAGGSYDAERAFGVGRGRPRFDLGAEIDSHHASAGCMLPPASCITSIPAKSLHLSFGT